VAGENVVDNKLHLVPLRAIGRPAIPSSGSKSKQCCQCCQTLFWLTGRTLAIVFNARGFAALPDSRQAGHIRKVASLVVSLLQDIFGIH
jgi:hypothetical protein